MEYYAMGNPKTKNLDSWIKEPGIWTPEFDKIN